MAQSTQAHEEKVIQITQLKPTRGWRGADFRELWRYRELIFFLTWRDIKVRYKQTLLGAAWAIIKPLFSMVIFYFIFNRLAKVPTDGVPGPIFYYSGLLPWVLFQDGVTKAGNSLVQGSNLITKVYFPRLAIPISAVMGGIVDFMLAFVVLLAMMLFYGIAPTSRVSLLPIFLLLALITALGVGLWLSALNVSYRDIGYVIPFIVQAWLYASPVTYSTTLIPEGIWSILYGLNPMAGVVQGFRWAILGAGQPSWSLLAMSTCISFLFLLSGIFYFRRMERAFADIV